MIPSLCYKLFVWSWMKTLEGWFRPGLSQLTPAQSARLLSALPCSTCNHWCRCLSTLIILGAHNQRGNFNQAAQVWWNLSLVAHIAKFVNTRENWTPWSLWRSAHLLSTHRYMEQAQQHFPKVCLWLQAFGLGTISDFLLRQRPNRVSVTVIMKARWLQIQNGGIGRRNSKHLPICWIPIFSRRDTRP